MTWERTEKKRTSLTIQVTISPWVIRYRLRYRTWFQCLFLHIVSSRFSRVNFFSPFTPILSSTVSPHPTDYKYIDPSFADFSGWWRNIFQAGHRVLFVASAVPCRLTRTKPRQIYDPSSVHIFSYGCASYVFLFVLFSWNLIKKSF